MKTIKQILGLAMLTFMMVSFSQCSSAQKLQKETPAAFGEIYCQKWVSGIAQGPSGLNIFIEVKEDDVQLDSVYFRGKATKLIADKSNKWMYVGRFISKSTEKMDVMISSDPKQEYGNKAPELPIKIPFELVYNECVISYKHDNKTKYFKLTNVVEKESLNFPMSPAPNNN